MYSLLCFLTRVKEIIFVVILIFDIMIRLIILCSFEIIRGQYNMTIFRTESKPQIKRKTIICAPNVAEL